MQTAQLKQQFDEIIELLPEPKIKAIFDFVRHLRDKEINEAILQIQMTSEAYQEWLSTENDIYDEVFKDGLQ